MISRIRIEAFGATADEVERTLYPHADEFEKVIGEKGLLRGECVIERDLAAPDGPYAFKGRLLLYADTSVPITDGNIHLAGNAATSTASTVMIGRSSTF